MDNKLWRRWQTEKAAIQSEVLYRTEGGQGNVATVNDNFKEKWRK